MIDTHSRRALDQRVSVNADQAEFAALLHGSTVMDAGIYDDRVADVLDDYEPKGALTLATWQARDLEYDTAVGDVHREIATRKAMMGVAYPFDVSDGQIIYRRSSTSFYEFCLAICSASSITAGKMVQLPRNFERIVALLIRAYFGPFADAVHTGAPRDIEVGKSFANAMKHVHQRTGEWTWKPDADLPDNPSVSGDEGVDFIVWTKALDDRLGHLFVLGQCACGNDWDTKFSDIKLESLKKWFGPLSFVEPVRCFVTPRQISTGKMREAQREAGIVFDRSRLATIAHSTASDPKLSPLMGGLPSLCDLVVANFSTRSFAMPPAKRHSKRTSSLKSVVKKST